MTNYLSKDGLEYFWGKMKDKLALKVDKYIAYKQYTNDYMYNSSSNNNCTGYDREFATVVANDWNMPWFVKFIIKTDLFYNNTTHYPTFHEVLIGCDGVSGTTWVRNYNVVKNTSYRAAHYINVYRPQTAAKHASAPFRMCFRAGDQSSKTAHPRSYDVYLVEAVNCTCTLNDALDNTAFQKWYYDDHAKNAYYWSATSGGSFYSTNFNICDNGLQETGDADYTACYIYHNYFRGYVSNKLRHYSIFAETVDGKYESLTTSAADSTTQDKVASTTRFRLGKLYYFSDGTTRSADYLLQANVYLQYYAIDFRYTANITTTGLTNYAPVYIVGNYDKATDSFTVDSSIWTHDLPTEEDGKIYILLGYAYTNYSGGKDYRVTLRMHNTIYYYKDGGIKIFNPPNSHTHTKSEITDFPTSLPASDVYSWAKASTKPSYAWSEITGKPSTFSPSSHTHDDRYYTESEVDTNFIKNSQTFSNWNAFGNLGNKKLYIDTLDNIFWGLGKRYFVTATLHDRNVNGVEYPYIKNGANIADDDYFVDSPATQSYAQSVVNSLFDGGFEGGIQVAYGKYLKIHIQFSNEDDWKPSTTSSAFPGYPYGAYYFTHYYNGGAEKIQVRTYQTHTSWAVGWHLDEASIFYKSGTTPLNSSNEIWKLNSDGYYTRKCIEIIVYGRDNTNATSPVSTTSKTQLTEILYFGTRATMDKTPVFVKGQQQKLYDTLQLGDQVNNNVTLNPNGNVTAIQFSGTLNGKATSASSADSVAWANVSGKPSFFSGNYNDLTNKPTINKGTVTSVNGTSPDANGNVTLNIPTDTVTEATVSGWGFTKNTGTYSKPSGGIPKTDLASDVQTSLGKADTALQEHQDLSGKYDKSGGDITGTNIQRDVNTASLTIRGGHGSLHGGYLTLYGDEYTTNEGRAGGFRLSTSSGGTGGNSRQNILDGNIDGSLTWNDRNIVQSTRATNDSYSIIYGGNTANTHSGGWVSVSGPSRSSYPNSFRLGSTNGTTAYVLMGDNTGNLTWRGKKLLTEDDIALAEEVSW